MKHPEYLYKWFKVFVKKNLHKTKDAKPIWVFFLALGIFSLGNQDWSHYQVSNWSSKSPKLNLTTERFPANDQCSDFNLSEVQAENQLIEKSQFTHHLVGQWHHLNFKTLPFREVAFLKRFNPELSADQKSQISSCKNTLCILESLTGSTELSALAWNWYLKSGIVLDPRSFSLSELKDLWKISEKLPDEYFYQDEVKVITKTNVDDSSCFYFEEQTLVLNELCSDLSMSITTALTQKYLPRWLKTFPQWKNALTKPKTPPVWMESFWSLQKSEEHSLAKEISLYILHGEAREITKSFLEDQLFKQKWGKASEVKRQLQADLGVWRKLRTESLNDCLTLHRSAFTTQKRHRSIASLATPHPLTQCVRESAGKSFLLDRKNWLLQSGKACKWRQPESDETIKNYYGHLQTLITKDIDQLEWEIFANGIEWLNEFEKKEKALLVVDPTESYFKCQGQTSEKSCYQQNLSSSLRSRLPASATSDVLEDYSFEAIEQSIRPNLAQKKSWIEHHFAQSANGVWKKCWSHGTQEMAKIKSPLNWVSPGLEYIDARFAQCLDYQTDQLVGSLFPRSDAESDYWKKTLHSSIKTYWKNVIVKESLKEKEWLKTFIPSIKDKLSYDLKSLMSKSVTFVPKEACVRRLSFHYPTPLYFHARYQLNQEMGQQICNDVLQSEDMKNTITKHRENRWNVLGKALKVTLVDEWENRVRRYCLGRVPASQVQSLLESESMKGCIRDQFELAWPISANEVGLSFSLPGESLDEFKDDIKAISQAVLQEKLRQ